MFDVSSNKTSIEFAFQRSTSQNAIKDGLGHEANEEEIEAAKQNAFSVDYVFCSNCEDRFGEIERDFIEQILPRFRGNDMTGISELDFENNVMIRKFFLLQILRTSVADEKYKISHELKNRLRLIILDERVEESEIVSVPLNISYLNTIGGDFEYTKNNVGIAYLGNKQIIMFNDFIIQVFDKISDVAFIDFFGVNEKATIDYFTNFKEEVFRFKVFDPIKRKEILANYTRFKTRQMLEFYVNDFQKEFQAKRGFLPTRHELSIFIQEIIYGNRYNDFQRYSSERYKRLKYIYIGNQR
ncbi:MAG: hypothetical protein WKF66_16185 [Pedobacter sp.]